VQGQEADAVGGENKAKAQIAAFNADLAIREAEARQRGEVARSLAEVEVQKAKAKAEQERLTALEVVVKEIERRKIEIAAGAEAERIRQVAKGDADAIYVKYEAEARGIAKLLESKAHGYEELIKSCGGDAKAAATLLMVEKIEDIVAKQVEAIKNLKIDKVTVWDSAGAKGDGSSTTANFASSLIKSLPPLHDVAQMAGVDLPAYLGRVQSDKPDTPAPATGKK
jgi:flotillin